MTLGRCPTCAAGGRPNWGARVPGLGKPASAADEQERAQEQRKRKRHHKRARKPIAQTLTAPKPNCVMPQMSQSLLLSQGSTDDDRTVQLCGQAPGLEAQPTAGVSQVD